MTSVDGSQISPIKGYDKKDFPVWLIICIAVGSLILILLIILLIVCLVKRSRRVNQDSNIDEMREELGLPRSPKGHLNRTASRPEN